MHPKGCPDGADVGETDSGDDDASPNLANSTATSTNPWG
jgi:hypothetical protein